MPRLLAALLCLFIGQWLSAQDVSIIPQPVSLQISPGYFKLESGIKIKLDGSGLESSARFLQDYLRKFYGLSVSVAKGKEDGPVIRLNFERMDKPIAGAYRITISEKTIDIAGDNEAGVFYGIQTLIQLLPLKPSKSLLIPAVNIEDYPRFAYRGLHLDAGRHFFTVAQVKQYIDFIALHKMNYFHWHLTEDQGWRIEIKKYPLLTQVGSCRAATVIGRNTSAYDSTPYCGFYTQEQIREVVRYASERYITIIPEIELPGHAMAALAAYPNLGCTGGPYKVQERWGIFRDVFCAGNDTVFQFLQNVLDEVIALFPSQYIHIGGDECPKDRWKTCVKCQRRIKENNLKDEHGLQSYFVRRIENYLSSKGRSIIGWDEILEGGLAPKATVMSWRGEQGGIEASKQGHNVIMTPGAFVYFDHAEKKNEDSLSIGGYLPVEKVYQFEPVPAELTVDQAVHVIGAQANLFSEYIPSSGKLEYMIFPRVTALSEVLWSPKTSRHWAGFSQRLQKQFQRYDLWKVHYNKAYFDIKPTILPSPDHHGVVWALETNLADSVTKLVVAESNSGPAGWITLKEMGSSELSRPGPITVTQNSLYKATLFEKDRDSPGGWHEISRTQQQFGFNKATGKTITLKTNTLENFPGNGGAFSLVNGAESEKGINSYEWLGFQDADMVAVIDLDSAQEISSVSLHVLDQKTGRFYAPAALEVAVSSDGTEFRRTGSVKEFVPDKENMGTMTLQFAKTSARFVQVTAKNPGIVPEGQPYAGGHTRFLVDEIRVD